MKPSVTIAGERIRHNCPAVSPCRRPVPAAAVARWGSVLWLAILGCAATPAPPVEVPVWELADAEPVKPRLLGRARVSYDRPLPHHLTQPLCKEFSLIVITEPDDWADVRRRLGLELAPLALDLARGAIVGILANVGECANGTWPIQLETVRTQSGEGSLEARLAGGLYYPLLTAGYLELAYVPGLRTVRKVEIGPRGRTFIIRSRSPSHSH